VVPYLNDASWSIEDENAEYSTGNSIERRTDMRTIPAREIKRRGISAVDEELEKGPIHVIKNDEPRYVIMSESHYAELVDAYQEAYVARVKESLEDVKAGRVRRWGSAQELIDELELEG
jgi:PHD/YefM family antitoxin component YafN of YafNO toxin-antitoxin module